MGSRVRVPSSPQKLSDLRAFFIYVMMYYTYILYSKQLDVFYVGFTGNLDARLTYHNGGFEQFTKKGVPWILVWAVEKPNKVDAMALEKKIKNLGRARKLDFMKKYSECLKISLDDIGFEN